MLKKVEKMYESLDEKLKEKFEKYYFEELELHERFSNMYEYLLHDLEVGADGVDTDVEEYIKEIDYAQYIESTIENFEIQLEVAKDLSRNYM